MLDMVALRSQNTLPEDPVQHLIDYFGNERSPLWDQMESMQEENEAITTALPEMETQIETLQQQLVELKRTTPIFQLYKEGDPANFAMKTMVNKLSGFAKFELNHEINAQQFCNLVMKMSVAPKQHSGEGEEADASKEPEMEFSEEKRDNYLSIFKRALIDDECPFKGDLSNETYNEILAALRAFDPSAEWTTIRIDKKEIS